MSAKQHFFYQNVIFTPCRKQVFFAQQIEKLHKKDTIFKHTLKRKNDICKAYYIEY